jgi:hypothetical protein
MEEDIELLRLRAMAKAKAEAEQEVPVEKEEPGVLDYTMRGLNYVGGLGRGTVAAAIEPIVGKDLVSPEEIMTGQVPGSAELLERGGMPGWSLSDLIPGAFSETGEGLPLEKKGTFDITARGFLGVPLDVATDPTTYILPGVKGVGMGAKVLRAGLDPIGQALGLTAKGVGKVGTAVAGKASQFTPGEAQQYLRNRIAVDRAVSLLTNKQNLDEAQQLAYEAIRKMRDTVRKAGLNADAELAQIIEGKNVEVNLKAIKERVGDLPEKQRKEAQAIVDRAEKDLVAYRPIGPEFATVQKSQQGLEGLTYPEIKTQAEMIPPGVKQELPEQAEMFPLDTVTKKEAQLVPSKRPEMEQPSDLRIRPAQQELLPMQDELLPLETVAKKEVKLVPSQAVEVQPSSVEAELALQQIMFPETAATKIEGGILPSRVERIGRSDVFPRESSPFSTMTQEPLPLPARGTRAEAATLPADLARRLKQIFQKEANYAKSSPVAAKGAPRAEEFADVADAINANLRQIEGVQNLDDFMRQGMVMQQSLERAEQTPLQFLKTQNEDTTAMLARAAKRAGDMEVFDLANQLSAARKIIGKGDYGDWVNRAGIRKAGRGALRAIDMFQKTGKATGKQIEKVMKDPAVPPQIWLEMLRNKSDEKESEQ